VRKTVCKPSSASRARPPRAHGIARPDFPAQLDKRRVDFILHQRGARDGRPSCGGAAVGHDDVEARLGQGLAYHRTRNASAHDQHVGRDVAQVGIVKILHKRAYKPLQEVNVPGLNFANGYLTTDLVLRPPTRSTARPTRSRTGTCRNGGTGRRCGPSSCTTSGGEDKDYVEKVIGNFMM
jgi:hypothetical protein